MNSTILNRLLFFRFFFYMRIWFCYYGVCRKTHWYTEIGTQPDSILRLL